ncbi:tyrosine-type recombinase/integrase [Corticimicrobacter populi]|uniref:Integrase n=1 Tax=Corticimicrobacter populi TaxID=2175229 RepID=A0A2V1K0H8_9BURK|nr:integrase arm-type DNA-binding domain-containing protein [Corticimicrobacter populi]PWF21302.1 integrase [Corticimicrobacter populi]
MTIHLLTERSIRTAVPQVKPYTLRDGGSLFLHVQPSGGKLWRYRYRMQGRGYVYAIGRYPDCSLEEARQACARARALVRDGIHPLADRQRRLADRYEAGHHTFSAVAERWMAFNSDWSPGYASKVQAYLHSDVLPVIGRMPVSMIRTSQLRPIIQAVADRGARTAAVMVRQWLGQIFTYAQAHGYCEHHPVHGLRGLLKRGATRHHPPLDWNDIPVFFDRLEQWPGHRTTILALRLLALTFVRTGELRQACWDEFDLQAGLWHIPPSRMKMRRAHIVPLSVQALCRLRELHTLTGQGETLFPNMRNPAQGIMGRSSLNRAIGCLGYAGRFSAHGFRATATTLLGLLGYPDKQVDLQLAHRRLDSSRAPYDHARFLSSRRQLMQDWADILERLETGATLDRVTQEFGPVSARRAAFLGVVQRE